MTSMHHPPIEIDSFDDPRIAIFRDARDVELRGSRFTARRFLVESEAVLRRMLGSGFRVESMLLTPDRFAALRGVLAEHEPGAEVYLMDERMLREHAGYRHHHGVLAIGERPAAAEQSLERFLQKCPRNGQPLVALENITHVDNLGAFFRNAAALGARGVLMDNRCTDPLFRKTIRFSMGYVFRVPWVVVEAWHVELERLRAAGHRLIALESGVGARPLREVPRDQPPVLIFGNEGHGLQPETLNRCDTVCEIPLSEGVPSVNVATAGAIALYEWMR